jgi:membrane protein implicated in regulation of membrane protease activity
MVNGDLQGLRRIEREQERLSRRRRVRVLQKGSRWFYRARGGLIIDEDVEVVGALSPAPERRRGRR